MASEDTVLAVQDLNAWYGSFHALKDINLEVRRGSVTALIGPSGCGKSTLLRCMNRMNDLIPGAAIEGSILFNQRDIYRDDVDPTEMRSRIGMVFQKPNPFPKSIYDNVTFGLRINGYSGSIAEAVERSLRRAALGTRSRTGSKRARSPCPADSSRGCASRGRWPWSRR